MKGNKNYLEAKIIELSKVGGKVRQNILLNLIPLFLGIPRRIHFKSLTQWGNRNETTYHNWFKRHLDLLSFNLYFCTRKAVDYVFVLSRYKCRFQIEFLFRDGKQFTGLMHCQSTDEVKFNNHFNLSLTAVSVAHSQKDQPFSMKDISEYYHNLQVIDLFSEALGLDPNSVKNNPKIIKRLLSKTCHNLAA